MDKGLIPRRYAKALYQVACDRKDADTLYTVMQTLAASFAAEPKLGSAVANPFVSATDKAALISTAAGNPVDVTFADFLKLLEQNRRFDIVRDIALAYIDIYRQENKIYRIDIVSAAPMAEVQRQRLENAVKAHLGEGTMEFNYSVNPELIGGFTVTVNSERLDASVANTLKQLRLQLMQN